MRARTLWSRLTSVSPLARALGEARPSAPACTYDGLRAFSSAAAPSQVEMIKQLRERSGAPMMDCKKSLASSDWDLETAFADLRKRGLAAVGKKAARTAAEGLLGLSVTPAGVAIIEINSETDFVARNEQFQDLVASIAKAATILPAPSGAQFSLEDLKQAATDQGSVSEKIDNVAVVVRENINLRRAFWVAAQGGVAGTYVHKSPKPGMGAKAAAVVLQAEGKAATDLSADALAEIKELANQVAMHSVAVKPQFLSRETVDASELENELSILRSQAAASGKPANIIEKIVNGRLNKYYEEVCLVDQKFVLDEKDGKKVSAVVAAMGKSHGVDLKVLTFLRVECGEGIEKEETDFAAEVKKTAGM